MSDGTVPIPGPQPSPDSAEVAEHFANFHNKRLQNKESWRWYASKLWLIERRLIPDDRPQRPIITNRTAEPPRAIPPDKPSWQRGPGKLVGSKNDPPPKRKMVLVRMSDVEQEETPWLWPDRIPLGTLSMICGSPGDGKSSLALAIASIVSQGGRWPDRPAEPVEPGNVVILQAEMGLATTVRKRLGDEGANLDRVFAYKTMEDEEGRLSPFSLSRDMPILEEAVEQHGGVRLVVIDPISSYLAGMNQNDATDVRDVSDPLIKFAEKHRLAVLLVHHLTKLVGGTILSRISGAGTFGQASRMIWYVSRHPDNRHKRVMSFVKGNLTDGDPQALTYQYSSNVHQFDAQTVEWLADEVSNLLAQRAADVREQYASSRGPMPVKKSTAAEFLVGLLAQGPCMMSAAQEKALQCGYKETTFKRAVKALEDVAKQIERYKRDSDNRTWLRLTGAVQKDLPLDLPEDDDNGAQDDASEDESDV